MWASHDDRVQWEVGQWRRARRASSEGERHISSVATIERTVPAPRPEAVDERKASVMSIQPLEVVEAQQPKRASIAAWFVEMWRRLKEKFDNPMKVPADVVVQAPAAPVEAVDEPVIAAPIPLFDPEVEIEPEAQAVVDTFQPVVELAVVEPVVETPTPAVEDAPAPEAPAKPRRPRKPTQRPTNKDMLKSALDVLKKVEQRLEHVETELAEIDEAVRAKQERMEARDDEPPESGVDFEHLPL
jgi:ribonuclease E